MQKERLKGREGASSSLLMVNVAAAKDSQGVRVRPRRRRKRQRHSPISDSLQDQILPPLYAHFPPPTSQCNALPPRTHQPIRFQPLCEPDARKRTDR
jgi:hypothetical protein